MNTEHTTVAIFLIILSSFVANAIHYIQNPSKLMLITVLGSAVLGVMGALMLAFALKEDEESTAELKSALHKWNPNFSQAKN
jgi:Co/Zn/Cd efflux system component